MRSNQSRMVMLLVVCLVYSGLTGQNKKFELIKEEGDISIYERWIIYPNSNPPQEAREVMGEWIVNSSIHTAVALLKNEENIMRWQKHVTKFKVYLDPDTSTWLEYSYHDIPWPVSDQDHILRYESKYLNNEEVYIEFKSVIDNKRAPEYKGVTRMELLGSWTLRQITDSKVKATYKIISKPLGIPRFLTDPIIRRNLMTTIKSFTEVLEDNSK